MILPKQTPTTVSRQMATKRTLSEVCRVVKPGGKIVIVDYARLQANCLRCPRPELCARALMDETIDCGWQEWRDYCPNATELSMFSAVNACRADVDGTKAEPTR